jgi:hypothetical protein
VIVMFAVAGFAYLSGSSVTGADAWAQTADLSSAAGCCTGARR